MVWESLFLGRCPRLACSAPLARGMPTGTSAFRGALGWMDADRDVGVPWCVGLEG